MTRALVTGGGGFVGANLVRRLLADGCETHVLLRPGGNPWRLVGLGDKVVRHAGDVANPESVARAVEGSRPDWVFHLAAYGQYPDHVGLERMIETNFQGTATVIGAAVAGGVEAIVVAGSSSEYGLKDHAPSESERLAPNSDYAVTKAAATMYADLEARRTGVRIAVLRLYSTYGPWEEPTRLWPTLVVHALDGHLPRLAAPDTARDFVYVDDVTDAFVRAATQPTASGVFNVASGTQSTLAGLVELVRRHFSLDQQPVWGSMRDRTWDTSVWVGDARRARAGLGWTAETGTQDGLARFCDWLRSEPWILDFYRGRVQR